MMRSLWTGATGMIAQQTNVDTIANNLSNVNTSGYKAEKTEFKSLLYQTLQTKTTSANGEEKPISAQVGLGTRVASNTSIFTQGSLIANDSKSAFAIEGNGLFSVRGADGQIYYTRNGNFSWVKDGNVVSLCTQEGYHVLDSNGNVISLPANVSSESVQFQSSTGLIGYEDGAGNYHSLNQRIGIYQFRNPAGLEKESNSLLSITEASGAAMSEYTNNNLTKSKVVQGYLEGSNVQLADEMVNLIVAQRAYEMNSKVITTSDDMLGIANQLKR